MLGKKYRQTMLGVCKISPAVTSGSGWSCSVTERLGSTACCRGLGTGGGENGLPRQPQQQPPHTHGRIGLHSLCIHFMQKFRNSFWC